MPVTVLVPPPRYAGTFPVSTQELVQGSLPPRRGVANTNRALLPVAYRIFFFEGGSQAAGSHDICRMVYWNSLGSLKTV